MAASVNWWGMLITHYQFWRQWNFITFALFCLNRVICHTINLPLKLEKQLLWRLLYGVAAAGADIPHIGFIVGTCFPGMGNHLFGGKWGGRGVVPVLYQQSRNANIYLSGAETKGRIRIIKMTAGAMGDIESMWPT